MIPRDAKLSLKKCVNFNNGCYACNHANFTMFQTVDEMGDLSSANNAFYNCSNLTTLYPDYPNHKWPKLSSATNMFNNCKLNKDSILWLYNALPTWTSGTHNITIGCHIDHKYDPDVNLALKKLNMDYVTPIEEAGGTLTEEVTSDKGWTTTIQWNGTATENAYPAPTTTNEE